MGLQIIQEKEPARAMSVMAQRITASLQNGKVLWLVCGGSNIEFSVMAMNEIREAGADLRNLTVALTDERFGSVGHRDSNWQQLMDTGFNIENITTIPVLIDKSLEETIVEYTKKLEKIFDDDALVIAQLGIGTDGHIAGILPETMEVSDREMVRSFEASPYTRITLTLSVLAKIPVAYAFVFGPAKKEIITRLQNEIVPPSQMPAQIMKQIPEAYLYTDQILKNASS
ncbi:MAG: 6-phosphogluconolactonase [bacterium]|nr:6-phosphogluconolactonase [bacterium]